MPAVHHQQSETERQRRAAINADTRTATALGISLDELRQVRSAKIENITTVIRAEMVKQHADDPMQILPEILLHVQEVVVIEARRAAKAVAEDTVSRMLRRAITP
jgi:hypothetical protein